MENQLDTQFSQEAEMQPKRPQFLTVLCILSFICAGLMFLFSVIGIAMNSPEKQLENIEQMRQISPATADQFEAQLLEQQNSVMGKIQPYLSLLFLIVGVLGVIQMYNLKKIGFYLYTATELIPYVFMLFGGKQAMAMMGSMGMAAEAAIIIVISLMLIIDIAFIVMYAMNLKHMK